MYVVTIFRLDVANKEYASGDAAMRAVRAVAKADGLKAVTRSEPDKETVWATVAAGHLVDKDGQNQWGFLVDCSEPSQGAVEALQRRIAESAGDAEVHHIGNGDAGPANKAG